MAKRKKDKKEKKRIRLVNMRPDSYGDEPGREPQVRLEWYRAMEIRRRVSTARRSVRRQPRGRPSARRSGQPS